MDEGIDLKNKGMGVGKWEQMKITICCQPLFCWLFYSRLSSKKEKDLQCFHKSYEQYWPNKLQLSFCTFKKELILSDALKVETNSIKPSISLIWTIIDPDFPLVIWACLRVKRKARIKK